MNLARPLSAVLVALLLGCSAPPPGGQPPPPGCSGEVPVCPIGAFTCCSQGEMASDYIVPCCQNGEIIRAHARAAGWLSHACSASCSSGECAISASGHETCCFFDEDGGAGACDQP